MRRLSATAASLCENAITKPRCCRCRCGGACHGLGRANAANGSIADLPLGDPHRTGPEWIEVPLPLEYAEEERWRDGEPTGLVPLDYDDPAEVPRGT